MTQPQQQATGHTRPDEPPTRLIYGEDLGPGMVLRQSEPCQHSSGSDAIAVHLGGGQHPLEDVTVLEVREEGGVVSAILVRRNGDQLPLYVARKGLIRQRVDQ